MLKLYDTRRRVRPDLGLKYDKLSPYSILALDGWRLAGASIAMFVRYNTLFISWSDTNQDKIWLNSIQHHRLLHGCNRAYLSKKRRYRPSDVEFCGRVLSLLALKTVTLNNRAYTVVRTSSWPYIQEVRWRHFYHIYVHCVATPCCGDRKHRDISSIRRIRIWFIVSSAAESSKQAWQNSSFFTFTLENLYLQHGGNAEQWT